MSGWSSRQNFTSKSLIRPRFDQSLCVECIGEDEEKRKVFRLIDKEKGKWNKKCFGCIKRRAELTQLRIEKYLHWSFATSFPALFGTLIFAYCFLIFLFTLVIWSFCEHDDYVNCISPSFNNTSNLSRINNSFHLSWTTFSTVGYGVVYPTTRGADEWNDNYGDNADEKYEYYADACLPVTLVCSLEAFTGILYASLSGAILVAKMLRIYSVAPVIFSNSILLRYHNAQIMKNNDTDVGNLVNIDEKNEEEFEKNSKLIPETTPCPILEFRVLNRLSHRLGGELIHCHIVCLAKVVVQQKSTQVSKRKAFKRLFRLGRHVPKQLFGSETGNGKRSGSTAATVEKHDYLRVQLMPDFHPCFKRVWRLHHVLDHTSPLLTYSARKIIKQNFGKWPKEWINAESFADVISFEKLIVNFSGTSPRNASDLSIQQEYYKDEIWAGCKFSSVCFKSDDDYIAVDSSMINVVKPQRNGTWKDIKKIF